MQHTFLPTQGADNRGRRARRCRPVPLSPRFVPAPV